MNTNAINGACFKCSDAKQCQGIASSLYKLFNASRVNGFTVSSLGGAKKKTRIVDCI